MLLMPQPLLAIEKGLTRKLSCITLEDPSAVVMDKEPIRAGGDVLEHFDERLPARGASEPLWDPKGERLRG